MLLGEVVEVDHFIALVVTSLHRLNGARNILLGGGGGSWVLVTVVVHGTSSHSRCDGSVFFRCPGATTTSLIECGNVGCETIWPVVALRSNAIEVGIVHELREDAGGDVRKTAVLCNRRLLAIECGHRNSLTRRHDHERMRIVLSSHALAIGGARSWEGSLQVLHVQSILSCDAHACGYVSAGGFPGMYALALVVILLVCLITVGHSTWRIASVHSSRWSLGGAIVGHSDLVDDTLFLQD